MRLGPRQNHCNKGVTPVPSQQDALMASLRPTPHRGLQVAALPILVIVALTACAAGSEVEVQPGDETTIAVEPATGMPVQHPLSEGRGGDLRRPGATAPRARERPLGGLSLPGGRAGRIARRGEICSWPRLAILSPPTRRSGGIGRRARLRA